jgi:predicted transcriptional regulator
MGNAINRRVTAQDRATDMPWHALAFRMDRAGYRQVDIARVVGVSQTAVSRFLNSKRKSDAPAPDSGFIEPHKPRVIRKIYDRDALIRECLERSNARLAA